MFIIIKYLLYLYVKVVVLAFIIFNTGANLEAYRIFNKRSFMVDGGWYSNDAIYPPIIDNIGEDTQISDLVYKQYKLLVFNLVYSRVLNGKFHLIKQISGVKIAKLLLYYLLGVSRVLVVTVSTILKVRSEKTRNGLLFRLFSHPYDTRKLIKINNKWVANGPKKAIGELMNLNKDKINSTFILTHNNKLALIEISERISVIRNTKFAYAIFKNNNNPQTAHKLFLEIANGDSVGIETDFKKSITFNDYNRGYIIRKYTIQNYTNIKESTILEQKITNFKQIKEEQEMSMFNQVLGAVVDGYNDELISTKYKHTIEDMKDIFMDVKKLLEYNGMEQDTKNVEKICKALNDHKILKEEDFEQQQ